MKEHHYVERVFGIPRSRPRRSTVIHGLSPEIELGSFSDSMTNVRTAVLTRVLLSQGEDGEWSLAARNAPLKGCSDVLSTYFDRVKSVAATVAGSLGTNVPLSREAYALEYSGGKRKLYLAAASSLSRVPVSKRDAKIVGFLKFEKDVRSAKPLRIPRVISPPHERYRVETGRYVRQAEKALYKAIDEVWGRPVVVKGANYHQVADKITSQWNRFVRPASLDCDVSKMDKNTLAEVIDKINDATASIFSGPERDEITSLLKWQLEYSAVIKSRDGTISYKMNNALTSGQVNTSLVGVAQVTAMVWTFVHHHGYDIGMVDAGDDFTIMGELETMKRVKREIGPWFKQFGLTLEIGVLNTCLEGIDFCQTHPVSVDGTYRMVRHPRTVASKDACSIKVLSSRKEAYKHFRSVGLGGLACFGGVPILQDFYVGLIRAADTILSESKLTPRQVKTWRRDANRVEQEDGSMKWYGHDMQEKYRAVSPATRDSFAQAFGYEPPEQVLIEAYYRQWSFDWDAVQHPYHNIPAPLI